MILANGFNWQRYRVLFTDGTELGDLDQRHIEPIGRAAKRLAKAAAKPLADAPLRSGSEPKSRPTWPRIPGEPTANAPAVTRRGDVALPVPTGE